MTKAKTQASICLIKEELRTEEDAMKDDDAYDTQAIEGVGTLYSERSYSSVPKWVGSPFEDRVDSSLLRTSSAIAVLSVPVQVGVEATRYFVLTFGYGRTMPEQPRAEERFGLKTVLNVADVNSLRRINEAAVAGNAMKASDQLPKGPSTGDFSMDIGRDSLEGVFGELELDGEQYCINGQSEAADRFRGCSDLGRIWPSLPSLPDWSRRRRPSKRS